MKNVWGILGCADTFEFLHEHNFVPTRSKKGELFCHTCERWFCLTCGKLLEKETTTRIRAPDGKDRKVELYRSSSDRVIYPAVDK